MLKRTLVLLILVLIQTGCYTSEETGFYKPVELSAQELRGWEQWKSEFLQLEDVNVGNGSLAAWGRKISANIEVRYASGDDRPIYRGPAIAYVGMRGSVFIHNGVTQNGIMSLEQQGIILGLNGMAVGGKRRMTVAPNLVCFEGAVGQSVSQGADPHTSCALVRYSQRIQGPVRVRKEKLIVEATLTDSCIPVFLDIVYLYSGEFRCRTTDLPRRDPAAPIWRIY
ncbi:MAG: hypothetical protein OEY28_02115 [Nitrospira sp.]|nr:hypothetical protein [Nitrospira sp.]